MEPRNESLKSYALALIVSLKVDKFAKSENSFAFSCSTPELLQSLPAVELPGAIFTVGFDEGFFGIDSRLDFYHVVNQLVTLRDTRKEIWDGSEIRVDFKIKRDETKNLFIEVLIF